MTFPRPNFQVIWLSPTVRPTTGHRPPGAGVLAVVERRGRVRLGEGCDRLWVVGQVLVVRHGQSTWNAEHRWAGHADPPLSPSGRRTADGLARRVADLGLEGVVASDLLRASDTALIVAEHCRLGEVEVDPRLRERRCDAWSGLTSSEIESAYPGRLDRWRRGELRDLPGDSEPWDEFADRVSAGLRAIAARGGRWLVVSHAGAFRVIEAVLDVPAGRVGNLEGRWIAAGADGLVDGGAF